MSIALRTPSVARAILIVVGGALFIMEFSAVGYRALLDWRDVENHARQRGAGALEMLAVLHSQAMLNRGSGDSSDPAIATMAGTMRRFSHSNNEMRLWLTQGPKDIVDNSASAGVRAAHAALDRPRDVVDQRAIAAGQAAEGIVDGWFRISRPVIQGVGEASHPSCAACHAGLQPGDVIGTYSVALNLERPRKLWISNVVFESTITMAIVLTILAVAAVLLNKTTLAPLRRLTTATRRLASGNLSVAIDDLKRQDELGTLARSLEIFRNNLAEKRCAESRLTHMARHDSLTGLHNRVSLNKFLDGAVTEATNGSRIAVASIDLGKLKEINDLHGHMIGDAMLKAVGYSLTTATGEGEFVARVGGDEFVAVKRFTESAALVDFVSRLESALRIEVPAPSGRLSPRAQIGVAIWPDDATTMDATLAKADIALQRAKSRNLRRASYYEAELDEAARRRRRLMSALGHAAERGELFLNYQVQKSIRTLKITGYEALLRWTHAEFGVISPAEFIPLAEECGAIVGIGEWVLASACREAASWPIAHKIAVNLSPLQLAAADLPQRVHEILKDAGLSPRRLELEITESAIIADKTQALDALRQIKALGVSIALDDFGRGYSSLETLRSFPFDKIKLDRFFVTELAGSVEATAIIRAIIALGSSLSIPVLAEGIESEDQLAILRRENCGEGQGYLFGRPQPCVDFSEGERHAC